MQFFLNQYTGHQTLPLICPLPSVMPVLSQVFDTHVVKTKCSQGLMRANPWGIDFLHFASVYATFVLRSDGGYTAQFLCLATHAPIPSTPPPPASLARLWERLS